MSSRTDSHNLSHAENVFSGDAYAAGAENGGRGLPRVGIVLADLGSPDALDVDGVSTDLEGSGINGALATAGVATMDVARVLEVDSSNAGDTTQTVTITGTDAYGATIVEDIDLNGTTAVSGLKAFKTVTGLAISAAAAGTVTVGTTDILGLPFAIGSAGDVVLANEADAVATIGTVVAADTTNPATATTGDVRGTYDPTAALNGSNSIKLYYFPLGRKTITGYGVPQFAG